MASRLKFARAGAAIAGASVALMMTAAIPAAADPAKGRVDGDDYVHGHHVNVGGDNSDINASLISFRLTDGTPLQMYCVEIDTPIDKKRQMVERPWDEYPNAKSPFHQNRDKINWVLHHGYPVVDTEQLTEVLTEAGVTLKDGIDKKEAISATQAAVWHFSDDTDLDRDNPLPKGPRDSKADVLALYDYLTGKANVGVRGQPTAALEVAPGELSGTAGSRIGPFTVNTTGDIDKLTTELPEGVKVTDVDGAELTAEKIKNGAQLYLDVPESAEGGEGKFELTATASVDTGRLFVGERYAQGEKTQSLIVATADKSELVASASGKWTEKPTAPPSTSTTEAPPTTSTGVAPAGESTTSEAPAPQAKNTSGELAETGASIFTPILIGVVLVGAGIGALLFQRHRKRA
ncbi:Cys-Gln thioester bond-forming surface protein [Actinophytocola glycyrrhizae]|uniref:Cys-Gln thioester bond-forming surface protein n=1 Tax=Actinophytocola glycyrrhizae TaxID=2044873 RepID=A0ABV9S4U5_9PSEU